jgi:hypothetical protein
MLAFLRSRRWIVARRTILLLVILVLAYRNYGGRLVSLVSSSNDAQRDILITRAEFQNNQPGQRPAWILKFRNTSADETYDQIQLEAVYSDANGTVLQKDTLVVKQLLSPGAEREVPSLDSRERGTAVNATVTVLNARKVQSK